MLLDAQHDNQYDIMAGMRGPDIDGDLGAALKTTFTARIRWIVLTRKRVGPPPNPETIPYQLRKKHLTEDQAHKLLTCLRAAYNPTGDFVPTDHFLAHARCAAIGLEDHGLTELADKLREFWHHAYGAELPSITEVITLAGGEG